MTIVGAVSCQLHLPALTPASAAAAAAAAVVVVAWPRLCDGSLRPAAPRHLLHAPCDRDEGADLDEQKYCDTLGI